MRVFDGGQKVVMTVLGELPRDCFLHETTAISPESVDATDERRWKADRNSRGGWHRELSQVQEL